MGIYLVYKYYSASSLCAKQRFLSCFAPGEYSLLLRKLVNKRCFRADRGKCIQDKFGNMFQKCINQAVLSIVRSSFFLCDGAHMQVCEKTETHQGPKKESVTLGLFIHAFAYGL